MGSRLAARRAGHIPKNTPTIPENATARTTASGETAVFQFAMLLSILLFSLMDATVKWLGAIYPTTQIMFFRCAVALVPILVIIAMRGGPGILRTRQWKMHLGGCANCVRGVRKSYPPHR